MGWSERRADKAYDNSLLKAMIEGPMIREFGDSLTAKAVRGADNISKPSLWGMARNAVFGGPAGLAGAGAKAGLSALGDKWSNWYYGDSRQANSNQVFQNNADNPGSDFMQLLNAMYDQQSVGPQQSPYDPLSPVNVYTQRQTYNPQPISQDPLDEVVVTAQRLPDVDRRNEYGDFNVYASPQAGGQMFSGRAHGTQGIGAGGGGVGKVLDHNQRSVSKSRTAAGR